MESHAALATNSSFLYCNRDRNAQGSDCGLHFHVGGEVNQTYICKAK